VERTEPKGYTADILIGVFSMARVMFADENESFEMLEMYFCVMDECNARGYNILV